jgi:DNA-directed RNA polymerase subunit RPC12/RpoP
MRQPRRARIPTTCLDCGAELAESRRKKLRRDRTPVTHFRCVRCEDRFLTVLDTDRLLSAIKASEFFGK